MGKILDDNVLNGMLKSVLKESGLDIQAQENEKPYPSWTEKKNRQGYEEDGSKGPWFSRSVAMCTVVFLQDSNTGKWYVLANQRGAGAADNHGKWNCPCGYLDYNESIKEGAIREVREETGVELEESQLRLMYHNGNPQDDALQNVVFIFSAVLHDDINKFGLGTTDGGEENEVSNIKWIPLEDVPNFDWAFHHSEYIPRFAKMLNINGEEASEHNTYSIVSRALECLEGGDTNTAEHLLRQVLTMLY